jgi:uncharacterized protein YaiI (UPF0178 family)
MIYKTGWEISVRILLCIIRKFFLYLVLISHFYGILIEDKTLLNAQHCDMIELIIEMSGVYRMKILVDADACPVKEIIEDTAAKLQLPVVMLIDTSHILTSDYSEIISVSKAPDAVDFALINRTSRGDIVVTQDYGVAAMALGKGAYAIHPGGKVYTDSNIDVMLMERDIAKKCRRAGERIGGHAKKRTSADNERFFDSFLLLCKKAMSENSVQ